MGTLRFAHERIPINITNAEAVGAIFTYLDYYSHRHIHGSIGCMVPAVLYNKHLSATNSDGNNVA